MDSRQQRVAREQVIDGVNHQTSAAANLTLAMTVKDRVVRVVTATAAGATFAITLPPVAEAAGQIFVINLVTKATYNVTIDDAGDDTNQSQVTLTASGNYLVTYSDGERWYSLVEATS